MERKRFGSTWDLGMADVGPAAEWPGKQGGYQIRGPGCPAGARPSQVKGYGCLWQWKGFVSQRPGIGDQSSAILDMIWISRGSMSGLQPIKGSTGHSLLDTVLLRYLYMFGE